MNARPQARPAAFELKGGRFTLSVLNIHTGDLDAIQTQLAATVAQAPEFLAGAPVVIDVSLPAEAPTLDLAALCAILRRHQLQPVGVRGQAAGLRETARSLGLAVLGAGGSTPPRIAQAPEPAPTPEPTPLPPLVLARPVRSGQQVYAQNRDLVIMGAVSPGAELIADGSIHVYGALRGRALAGAKGDETARILCHGMEAELLSIAGCYRLFEEPDPHYHGRTVHAHLDGERLILDAL